MKSELLFFLGTDISRQWSLGLSQFARIADEEESLFLNFGLVDESGAFILTAALDALTLTLYSDDTGQAIINSRSASDISGSYSSSSGMITAASDAAPIVITSATHGLSSGDVVNFASVGGNEGANGTWVVLVVTANTFALVGSVGTGTWTSGGTWTQGEIALELLPADNQIVGSAAAEGELEPHMALIEWTYNTTSKGKRELPVWVKNLGKVT